MRRRHIAAPVLLALVAFAALAGASFAGPGGGGPAEDSVYGGGRHAGGGACTDGTIPFCPPNSREFSVDAHSTPAGGSAHGTLEYAVPETGNVLVSGDVTCLEVDGDRAVVGGLVNEGVNAGTGFLIHLEDRGRPGAATRDRVSPVFLLLESEEPPGFPRTCPPFEEDVGSVGFFTQTFGDVAVTDR
jgi:hypothetical protein